MGGTRADERLISSQRDCPGRADAVYSQPDPLATLMLLQMIADAYEDRRVTLELHGDRMRKQGIKVSRLTDSSLFKP